MTTTQGAGPDPALGGGERVVAGVFLAIAAVCAAGAFIGLNTSSYWIDELFSLFVINHDGGWGEVLRRALTDTHPPAYYFIAYEWIHAFGSSEIALRSFSAICAVATLPVLFLGMRPVFTLPARSFAVALAAGSTVFFDQSQNGRSYALCLLIATGLMVLILAIHRRLEAGTPVPWRLTAGLWVLGLLGAFTHFYVFLEMGAAYLFLLIAARRVSYRWVVIGCGLALLGLMVVYVVSLLNNSQQDIHNMWFSNKPGVLAKQVLGGVGAAWSDFAIAAVALLALAPWAERVRAARGLQPPRPPYAPLAPLNLAALTIAFTLVVGLIVSFAVAPSFGKRNLMVVAPFFWVVAAWLYQAAAPDLGRLGGRVLAGVLIVLLAGNAVAVRARLTPQNEEWRASAAYVDQAPGCAGQPVPAVLPWIFGPSTPFFHNLAKTYFFGRYETQPERLRIHTPTAFAPATADPGLQALLRSRAAATGGCAILAWGVHDIDKQLAPKLRADIAATAGVPEDRVIVRTFHDRKIGLLGFSKKRPTAYVYERAQAEP